MSLGTRIFMGDLARAIHDVGNQGGNWASIAQMLGFRLTPDVEVAREPELAANQRTPISETKSEPRTQAKEMTGSLESPEVGELLEFEIEQSTAPAERIPTTWERVEVTAARPLDLVPLFNDIWERGVLLEMTGTPRPEGEIAVVELVRLIAQGESWKELPRERIFSPSKGCQLLLDAGLGMQPFAKDMRNLARSLSKVVGSKHTRTATFLDCPQRGVIAGTTSDEPYRPPKNGAVVLALSDLCGGGPASAIREALPEDWLEVAKTVRDAGCVLLVLNPYPPERWPKQLVGRFPIVHWDRRTTVAQVRRKRRKLRS